MKLKCKVCKTTIADKWYNCECCKQCYDEGNYDELVEEVEE